MGNKGSSSSTTPEVEIALEPISGAPNGFCESQSFLPWVSDISDTGPTTELTCATSLNLQIPGYKVFEYSQEYSGFLNKRMFFKAFDAEGNEVDLYNIDRYSICPQGCSIAQVICLETPLPNAPVSPESAVDSYMNELQELSDSARNAGQNLYSYSYALKIKDENGNLHFVEPIEQYVSGERNTVYNAKMIPDITPTTGNQVLSDALSVTGISAYSVYNMPQKILTAYSLEQDSIYALKTNSAYYTGGGYLTFYSPTDAPSKAINLPAGMQIIGLGCMKDCMQPVIIAGYTYEIEDLLYFKLGAGCPMLNYAMLKYGKTEVLAYLIEMFEWAYDAGLQVFTADQAKVINDIIGVIISGEYGLYSDANLFSGKMDDFMAMYCAKNEGLAICACYNSSSTTPLCSDRACEMAGYRSLKVEEQNCDPYNNMDSIKGLFNATEESETTALEEINANEQKLMSVADQNNEAIQTGLEQYQTAIANQIATNQESTNEELETYENELSTSFGTTASDIKTEFDTAQENLTNLENQLAANFGQTATDLKSELDKTSTQLSSCFDATSANISSEMGEVQADMLTAQDKQEAYLNTMLTSSQEVIADTLDKNYKEFEVQGSKLNENMNSVSELVEEFGEQYEEYKEYLDQVHQDSIEAAKKLKDMEEEQEETAEMHKYLLLAVFFLLIINTAVEVMHSKSSETFFREAAVKSP